MDELRDAAETAGGEERRRIRSLLDFAFQGHLGRAVKAEATRLAELEAEMVVETDGETVPYRGVTVALANEADAARRAELERARDELSERLNPLHLEMLERVHGLTQQLGWSSYREACAELRGIDLEALAAQAEEFVRDTDGVYAEIADPELKRAGVAALGELRRSDLPRFFRAPALEALFPAERAVGAFAETVAGLGIDLDAQDNVHLDTESRPTKSSRAFCAPSGVPGRSTS